MMFNFQIKWFQITFKKCFKGIWALNRTDYYNKSFGFTAAKCDGELAHSFNFFNFLLDWLASALASVKPAWLNLGQHRGPTYSYNNGINCKQ